MSDSNIQQIALEELINIFKGLKRGTEVEIGVRKLPFGFTNYFGDYLEHYIYANVNSPLNLGCPVAIVPQSQISSSYELLKQSLEKIGLKVIEDSYKSSPSIELMHQLNLN